MLGEEYFEQPNPNVPTWQYDNGGRYEVLENGRRRYDPTHELHLMTVYYCTAGATQLVGRVGVYDVKMVGEEVELRDWIARVKAFVRAPERYASATTPVGRELYLAFRTYFRLEENIRGLHLSVFLDYNRSFSLNYSEAHLAMFLELGLRILTFLHGRK